MIKKILFLFSFFFFAVFLISAQDESHAVNGDSSAVYVIRNIDFQIDGRTRVSALMYYGEFTEGERIEGPENFENYLARKQQLIINQRNHDEVTVNYTLGEPEADGALPVNLVVYVRDTWNFIILPRPKYDSNEGFDLTLKARDYNFLGTMTPLRLDIGYLYNTESDEGRHMFNLALDSDTPFYALGFRWNLNFDHIFDYTAGDVLRYTNVSGVSVELPFGFTTANVGINQYLIVNEENSLADIDEYGLDPTFKGPYAATEIFGSWKIPTGLEIGNYDEVDYIASLSGKIAYRSGGVDAPRRPLVSLGQSIGFGNTDWIGNYREGFEASIGNINNFYFGPNDYRISVNADVIYHHRFSHLFGISARLQYRQWFNGRNYDTAETLRGFPDNDLRVSNMLSLNADFPFRILRFAPSEWFDSKKLRLFDFEMHLSPFVDIAFAEGLQKPFSPGDELGFKDGIFCGGFEIIIFPDFFRSLYLRISSGYNLKQIYNTKDIPKWDELFIGIGHHF